MDSIKDIIPLVVKKMIQQRSQAGAEAAIEQAWEQVSKKQGLGNLKLTGYRDDKLYIGVDSPARLYNLRLRKTKILKELQQQIPQVRDIMFKVSG